MSELLTTGQMIDALKVGEIAQAETCGKPFVTLNKNGGVSYCNSNGECKRDTELILFSQWRTAKWRILPNYVSFEEAIKAYQEGKTITCDYKGVHNGKLYTEKLAKNIPESEEDLSMYMIVNGKWTIEND